MPFGFPIFKITMITPSGILPTWHKRVYTFLNHVYDYAIVHTHHIHGSDMYIRFMKCIDIMMYIQF
jgi:hypothetical protein